MNSRLITLSFGQMVDKETDRQVDKPNELGRPSTNLARPQGSMTMRGMHGCIWHHM